MMVLFRVVFGLLLLASVLCFATYVVTKEPVWRVRGVVVLRWTLIAAAGFFGVLVVERLSSML